MFFCFFFRKMSICGFEYFDNLAGFSEVNLSTCPNVLAQLGVVGGGDVAGRAVRFFLSDQHVTRV